MIFISGSIDDEIVAHESSRRKPAALTESDNLYEEYHYDNFGNQVGFKMEFY